MDEGGRDSRGLVRETGFVILLFVLGFINYGWVFSFSCCASALAQQSQSAQEIQRRTDSHPTSQPDQRGSDSMPLTVKLLNTGKSDKESAQEAESVNETIALTKALVVATVFQFLALIYQGRKLRDTVNEMKRGTKAAETTAEAAKQANQTTRMSQRPWIDFKILPRVEVIADSPYDIIGVAKGLNVGGLQGYGNNIMIGLVYSLRNIGLSPAYNVVVKGRLRVVKLLDMWSASGDTDTFFREYFRKYFEFSGFTILASRETSINEALGLERQAIETLIQKGETELVFLVDAVVQYSYPDGIGETVGETGVTYLVTHKNSQTGGLFNPEDANIPASELLFKEIPVFGYSK